MTREYRLDETQRKFLSSLVIGALVMGGALLFYAVVFNFEPIACSLMAGLAFSVAAINYLQIQQVRFVINPEGIAYYQLGYAIFTPWENIDKVAKVDGSLGIIQMEVEGLVLREPAAKIDRSLIGFTAGWSWLTVLGKEGRLIPLGLFPHWRKSELAREFKKYAPHIFVR